MKKKIKDITFFDLNEPKIFESMGAAINWCDRHTYGGMSHYYEIKEVKE